MSGRIHDIVERGQCTTFVCLQAESSPQSNTNRRGKETTVLGGLNDWEINPINFEPYRPEVETAISEVSVRTPSFLHYGIRDMSPADDMDEFAGFVKALSSRVINGETLYLHCWGGKGRAGLVAACLLGTLYEQVDAEEALHRVGMYCQSRHSGVGHYLHSPETNEQREQVRQFYKSLREEK
jgi:protein-tyrosine phosphatase